MRILMVNKFHRLVGGTERHVAALTEVLEERGHRVIPFAMSHPDNYPSAHSPYFVSSMDLHDPTLRPSPWAVAERVIYSREARRKIGRLVDAEQPDIAHLHNIYHHLSPSVLDALAERRIPIVMTLHDYKLVCPVYTLWSNGDVCERCVGRPVWQCLVRRCNGGSLSASGLSMAEATIHRAIRVYDRVDHYIAPSTFLRQKHIEGGTSGERITHIPNFVTGLHPRPGRGRENHVLFAGRMTPFKGVATLLEAVAKARPSTSLVIAGDGPSRPELETVARRLALPRVRFTGHLGSEEVYALAATARFAAVPSEWYENCPYAVLEAMALGTPVLATRTGGIPELIDDGIEGILVDPKDVDAMAGGIERMFLAGQDLARMGAAGQARVARSHSPAGYLSALSRVYASVGAGDI